MLLVTGLSVLDAAGTEVDELSGTKLDVDVVLTIADEVDPAIVDE